MPDNVNSCTRYLTVALEAFAGTDARQLGREVLAMDVDGYRAAFRGSPMKRAKRPMLKRNAAVVLGNVGTADDADALTRARRRGAARA